MRRRVLAPLFLGLVAFVATLSFAGHPGRAQDSTSTPTPYPALHVSEVLPDPRAVDDALGEWIEIWNPGAQPVDMQGWQLVSGDESLTIALSLPIAAGSFVVLAERGDPAINGGLRADYQYSGLILENEDSLALVAPDGRTEETLHWLATQVQEGRSLERVGSGLPAQWQAAWQLWSGSAGDWGSPGAPTVPPPTPTPAPPMQISELLADPQAVYDEAGEWVEIYNPNPYALDLAGWALAAGDGPAHVLRAGPSGALAVDAASYFVVARELDPALNGGLSPQAGIDGLQLANEDGALRLLAPGGGEADRVEWGEQAARVIVAGRSLERLADGTWRSAVLPWPGSAGDWGSPGQPPPPAPPTPTPTPTLPAPTPFPATWPLPAAPSPLRIDEVAYRGDEEHIVIYNAGTEGLSLAGWLLGDKESGASAEALLALPDQMLGPGHAFVVARNGAAFMIQWRVAPNAQVEAAAPEVPVLSPVATGHFALDDGGDEVVLISPQGTLADIVRFGSNPAPLAGVEGTLISAEGEALQGVWGAAFPTEPDVRRRFLIGRADPLFAVRLPDPAPNAPLFLPGNMRALWGVLDAQSTLSATGKEPPRLVAARMAAQGLDFYALADPLPPPAEPAAPADGAPLLLPAWGWAAEGDRAVLLGGWSDGLVDRWALLPYAEVMGLPMLWQQGELLPSRHVAAINSGGLATPEQSVSLLESVRAAGAPLLPAGSDGRGYTGLAAAERTTVALLEAIRARRGWFSTQPGLWLTLQAETAQGTVWMGSVVTPANRITMHVAAGDRGSGLPITVALWQNGAIVAQTTGQTLEHTLLVPGGTILHATAARSDGAFAVSAALLAATVPEGSVLINEVMVAPDRDHNADGAVSDGDEYVELHNPGELPVLLDGWQLFDLRAATEGRRRFTFAAKHVIPGRGHLLLWRGETGVVLNNEDDRLYLVRPGGGESDQTGWEDLSHPQWAVARVPDGGAWQQNVEPSPGRANQVASSHLVGTAAAIVPLAADALPAQPVQLVWEESPPEAAALVMRAPVALESSTGQEISLARSGGLSVEVTLAGAVILPPGLLHGAVYIAQSSPAREIAGAGIRIYLRAGEFPALALGDMVTARGWMRSFRGERELVLDSPSQLALTGPGAVPRPLLVDPAQIGEALEGRLVELEGTLVLRDGDSLYLAGERGVPVRVMVARSLGWGLPETRVGERWRVVGVVGQLARATPWNGGYRILVRFAQDLVRVGG